MNTKSPPGDPPRQSAEALGAGEKPGPDASASEAFRDAALRLGEIREYIAYYIAVQADAAKLALRNGLFFACLGVLGMFAAASAVVVAVTLLLTGIARGLGTALGGRIWLGDLIVGLVILAGLAIFARIGFSMIMGITRKQTVQKHESRKRQQRSRFGRDIDNRANS